MNEAGAVAIVTGAGSGIGAGTAKLLAERGYRVALWDINEAGAKDVLDRIQDKGGVAAVMYADVSDQVSVKEATARTTSDLGPPRALVNNAGIRDLVPFFDLTAELWHQVIDTDLAGTFFCTQSVAAVMRDHGGGSVVNLSSVAASVSYADRTAYVAAKTGVIGLTRSMAESLAPLGIRVNVVSPGMIETPLQAKNEGTPLWTSTLERTPLRRFGKPVEAAEAIAFLLSDAASFITGVELKVDGGRTAVEGSAK
jgi:NAD(P)-dependent dehydrogenase (short-subunit alcohol dehydrogenase family)